MTCDNKKEYERMKAAGRIKPLDESAMVRPTAKQQGRMTKLLQPQQVNNKKEK